MSSKTHQAKGLSSPNNWPLQCKPEVTGKTKENLQQEQKSKQLSHRDTRKQSEIKGSLSTE